jgi:hypothetical protein
LNAGIQTCEQDRVSREGESRGGKKHKWENRRRARWMIDFTDRFYGSILRREGFYFVDYELLDYLQVFFSPL